MLVFIPIYSQFETSVVGDIIYFSYVYLMIGYIKRYRFDFMDQISLPFASFIVISIVIGSRIWINYLSDSYIDTRIRGLLECTFGCIDRHSIIILVAAVFIFFGVIKLKSRNYAWINWMAQYTLGVYFFHENMTLSSVPNIINTIFTKFISCGLIKNNYLFPIQYILGVSVVFIIGTLIEICRQKIVQETFMKFITSKYETKLIKIDKWFDRLVSPNNE